MASVGRVGQFGNVRGWWAAVILAVVLLSYHPAFAAGTEVYLLRGWFGVFSTGMDSLAEDLAAKGIKAEAIGHLEWKETVAKIVQARAAGDTSLLVLVGHSQGANNVIDMARALEAHKIPVDLLITLAPFLQDPVPNNVVRAINYYQSPGWGAPISGDAGFRGKISNVDIGSDLGTFHVNIDKSAKVQEEVGREILALSRTKPAAARPARPARPSQPTQQ